MVKADKAWARAQDEFSADQEASHQKFASAKEDYHVAGGHIVEDPEMELRGHFRRLLERMPLKRFAAMVDEVLPEIQRDRQVRDSPPWKRALMDIIASFEAGGNVSPASLSDTNIGAAEQEPAAEAVKFDNPMLQNDPLGQDAGLVTKIT